MTQRIFRFAPSPTGRLHLGHAYSALLNEKMAREAQGKLLLRVEDTDSTRCRDEFIAGIFEDMTWLGIEFDSDVRIQSQHLRTYQQAIAKLRALGILYRCRCTRSDLRRDATGETDPEGQPVYSGRCRNGEILDDTGIAMRLDMRKALGLCRTPLAMEEKGATRKVDPAVWGDVVVARKETGTSYHLAVVVDDALQGVTDVVRGEELLAATSIHRMLQDLLHLPQPNYHHHPLLRDDTGRKLSKSARDKSLLALRNEGATSLDIRRRLGF